MLRQVHRIQELLQKRLAGMRRFANAVMSSSVTLQRRELVGWWNAEIGKSPHGVEPLKFPAGYLP